MSIEGLTTREKSVMLARLVDEWEVIERVDYARICKRDKVGPCLFEIHKNHNFYTVDGDGNPHLMAWAWRVLNWAMGSQAVVKYEPLSPDTEPFDYQIGYAMYDWFYEHRDPAKMPPAVAQAAWLDKVLELAIEAGLVKVDEVKE